MSFSSSVKEELSRHTSTARHCKIAELAALISASGRILESENGVSLCIQTENEDVSRKCFTLLKKTFNIGTEIVVRKSQLKRGNVYSIAIETLEDITRVLQTTKLTPADRSTSGQLFMTNAIVIQKDCCKRAFLRGSFLASGSISDPEKGYHLEIVCADQPKAQQIQEVMCSFELDAKIVMRKKSHVVYLKEGEQIVEALGLMEAGVALMNLENIRIVKEMRNSVNRKVNCETANINKTVNAAVKQMEDIRYIERTVGFGELNPGLEEIARLRLQYPEATLKELGMMLDPQVGKSGVNHRLRKLSELAEDLRETRRSLL
ncbi:MAG: DNA-binding protein WhiA [Blautia sp.]|jgi:DNA-binding protein WhiA